MNKIYGPQHKALMPALREVAQTCVAEQEAAGIPAAYRRFANRCVSMVDYINAHRSNVDGALLGRIILAAQSHEPLLPRLGYNPHTGRLVVSLANVDLHTLEDVDNSWRINVATYNTRSTDHIPALAPEFTRTQTDLLHIQAKELADIDGFVQKLSE
jgi:hypothetical protein